MRSGIKIILEEEESRKPAAGEGENCIFAHCSKNLELRLHDNKHYERWKNTSCCARVPFFK